MRKKLLAGLMLLLSTSAFAGLDEALAAYKKGDYPGAIKEYKALGDAGNLNAQLILGALYSKGGAVERNDKIAAEWFQKAANQGNPTAQYLLGNLYEASKDLPKDYQQAASWYHKAAQQGLDTAQLHLGHLYSHGLGVPQNYNEAILWYGKSALQGNAEAQHSLGLMYSLGKGLTKNQQLAIGWLTKAAAQNYADSQLLLADIYQVGAGTDKKPVLAHALYELAIINKTALLKDATQKRDSLAKSFTPQQLEDSQKLALELNKPNNFSKTLASYLERSNQWFRFFPSK